MELDKKTTLYLSKSVSLQLCSWIMTTREDWGGFSKQLRLRNHSYAAQLLSCAGVSTFLFSESLLRQLQPKI